MKRGQQKKPADLAGFFLFIVLWRRRLGQASQSLIKAGFVVVSFEIAGARAELFNLYFCGHSNDTGEIRPDDEML